MDFQSLELIVWSTTLTLEIGPRSIITQKVKLSLFKVGNHHLGHYSHLVISIIIRKRFKEKQDEVFLAPTVRSIISVMDLFMLY